VLYSNSHGPGYLRLSAIVTALALPASALHAGPPEFAPGAAQANSRAFPQVTLGARVNGEAAISGLGDTLPAVAAYYGMTPSEFTRTLREDDTAWIDRKGRLLYIDHFPQPAEEEGFTDPLQGTYFPLEQTFSLNSRPGSKRVIYLDFDGHVTTGTAWNASSGVSTINSPAYTRDGDPAFSDAELRNIQDMWKQVAEDFAPFDVNITTQDPGQDAITRNSSGDDYYGTRVVITEDNFDNCGCGGFAYLTAFNDTGDYYKPAFVFNTSLVGAGEAITHEVGHNLSLHHDGASGGVGYYQGHGSGATGWAPIMGVGYYQPLVQWSKGEYSGANNSNEDDLAAIPAYGAPLMPDDHGDSSAVATALDTAANGTTVSLSGTGLIEARADVDVFSFVSGAGDYSISVDPAPYSPNLDILAELRDSTGALVNSANPVDSLPATLSGNLAAGEYFLSIDGVGKGDPLDTGYSDYGSLGRYSVTGSAADPGGLSAPVALAAAPDYSPNVAPLYVGFDGSASTDSDGEIVSWDWDFGDGASASGELVNHTYNAPGTYTVTLTVTDSDNLSDNDSLVITVDNQAPVAIAGANFTPGEAPVTVEFYDAGSYDQDETGAIVSRAWDFGDGNGSNETSPSHTYNAAGDFEAVLTVTDDLGATGVSIPILVEVTPPPFVDQFATSEIPGAGTVFGDVTDTHVADGVEQSIGERESGGRKSSRYSYLEHTWVFDVQPGDAVTLSLTGRQSDSGDNDSMELTFSVGGGAFQSLPIVLQNSPASFPELPLSGAEVGGEVRIRVTDSDQTAGNRSLDTVYIDQILIRSHSQAGGQEVTPPSAAANLEASAVSASQINLTWDDTSGNESGFIIQRSLDDLYWSDIATVAAGVESFSDSGLVASTTYYYRVVAYNGGGEAPSSSDWATTQEPTGITLNTASGYKVKGSQWVSLSWTPSSEVDIYRDDTMIATATGSAYDDDIGVKGGGSYEYKVCVKDSADECSNVRTVVF